MDEWYRPEGPDDVERPGDSARPDDAERHGDADRPDRREGRGGLKEPGNREGVEAAPDRSRPDETDSGDRVVGEQADSSASGDAEGQPDSDPIDYLLLSQQLTDAAVQARRVLTLGEVLVAQSTLAGWDAMLADEQAQGRSVHPEGLAERSFGMHLGMVHGMSTRGALAMLRDTVRLRDTLPVSYAAFCDARFPWRAAVLIVDASTGLTGDVLAAFDIAAAALAVDVLPHRLRVELERLRTRLDPDAASERAKVATTRRGVSARPEGDGQAAVTFHGPETDAAAVVDVLRQAAIDAKGREGETRALGALMYDIAMDLILHGAARPPCDLSDPAYPSERLGDLRVPDRKVIHATLLVTVPAATACAVSNEPARVAGWGSIPADEAVHIVAHTKYWTRVEVDPIDDAIIGFDSTERYIPSGLRKLLLARDQHCQGPNGCSVPAHRTDADHTKRFEHFGHTTEANLCLLCRPEHILKDAGYMDVRNEEGTVVWASRWGAKVVKKPEFVVRKRPEPDLITPPPF